MKESQARGLVHWMFFSDGKTIYSYDIVRDAKTAAPILEDLKNVEALAID